MIQSIEKSSRSFASILDYQFEREAEREKSNQTSTRPRVVRFANEAGQGPLVTHVGVTAPMYEGSNNMKKGKIFTNNPRSMKGTMTTIGQIHEHHNAKLLKILLRLGPLISNNPEELIKTLLPNTEKGFMPSSEAMEHVSMLFPKYEDYQNFIRNGHDQMDSLLIDILILQDLIPESNDSKETPHVLQTFTSNAKVNFSEIPICIETFHQEDLILLQELGNSISNNVQIVTSTQREHIHLSAVIVNNFVNHLYLIGQDLLMNQSLTFDILKPLIVETATKIENISPHNTQTGPAKRNDLKTIEKQLHLLKDSPYQELYKNITNYT